MARFNVRLFKVSRLPNSVNGNPRYTLHTSEGNYVTASDSAMIDVDNIARDLPRNVELHTTKSFRVWDIVPMEPEG